MKIVMFEGARGVGKSELARLMRQKSTNSISINCTGINGDSEEVLSQTVKNYENMLQFLHNEDFDNSPITYFFDRFFFSEMVYSKLYKSYDFTEDYQRLLRRLDRLAGKSEVHVIHLTTSTQDLERNLSREGKATLFNDERFADNIHKSQEQMIAYTKLFSELRSLTSNIKLHSIECAGMTLEEMRMCVAHGVR